jgi:cytochrome c556
MRFLTKTVLTLGMLAATAVIAAEATEPSVKARQELMDAQAGAAKVLGGMAKGEVAFDAAAAEAAKAALIALSADIPAKFETEATDPKTKAKAEIWANWDDFVAKAGALNAAATALDASTLEGVQAGMDGVGGACGACHKAYQNS